MGGWHFALKGGKRFALYDTRMLCSHSEIFILAETRLQQCTTYHSVTQYLSPVARVGDISSTSETRNSDTDAGKME